MNYYKRFIGDYQSDTAHLSIIEHGAYSLLLDYIYGTERKLPKQKESIYRICRAFESVEQNAIDSVLSQYFVEQNDGWVNEKALSVMASDLPRIEAAKINGKKGGRPKGKTQKKPSGFSKQNPEETQSESYPQPQPQPKPNPEQNPKKQLSANADVLNVFEFWKKTLNHQKAKLSRKRIDLIKKQLKLYDVGEMKRAIAGCSLSDFHMGRQSGCTTVYDSIELILRDSEKIEGFIRIYEDRK